MAVRPTRRAIVLTLAVLAASWPRAAAAQRGASPGNLDAFMARVLERRDEAWKKLHDYVLSETERFDLTGPAGVRLDGMRREYSWYIRDGYLIRSPIRFDGVTIPEAERRKYEENWLQQEKRRAARRARTETTNVPKEEAASGDDPSLQEVVGPRGEPRFVSESFFLKFKFEAGNYYLAGRERLNGRDVVRIEYYPKNLFSNRFHPPPPRKGESPKDQKETADLERRIERDLNKVAMVTLWIDPVEYQVVRYKFDNIDFGFMPARWLVRLDFLTGWMTMAKVLDGVWLPSDLDVQGSVTLATGSYSIHYARQLYDYKKAETAAKVRSIK